MDYHTYIAKMKWFMEGNTAYVNRYTGEETEPVYIYQFYMLLGKISGWTGLSLTWTFHTARALLGSLAALLMYRFMKKYSGTEPVVAALFAVMASGGYLSMVDTLLGTSFNSDRTDYFLQGRVWLAFLTFPHYSASLIGLFLLLEAHFGTRKALALPGGFLMSLAHPFLAAVFIPVVLLDGFLKKEFGKAVKTCTLYFIGLAPLTLLIAGEMNVEWVRIWREQTCRDTPDPLKFLLLSYGAVGIMGWYKAAALVRQKKLDFWLLWLLTASIMAYFFPLPNRREFAFFLSIPLGVLAAPVAVNICRWFIEISSRRNLGLAASVLFLYFCVWQVPVLYAQVLNSFNPKDAYSGFYITEEYREVFNLVDGGGVVLCSEWLGNMIPAYTCDRPYVGHISETLYYSDKKKDLNAFFSGKMSPEEMALFIAQNKIRWVIYDTHEKNYRNEHLRELLGSPVHEGKELVVWRAGF
ncbi:MAG: hypothetical protein HPY89_11245 [Pelotomaculum sp.]|nr:hypothetical protein [Pelotomaculum sp.]